MIIKQIKYFFLFLLTFLLGAQTIYAKTEALRFEPLANVIHLSDDAAALAGYTKLGTIEEVYVAENGITKLEDVAIYKNADDVLAWRGLAQGGGTGIKVIDDFLALAPKIDNLSPSNLPAGYQIVIKNNSKYIRRVDISNPNTPRLMVDETGTIVQYVKPTRLSSNSVLRNRLKQANGGTIPPNHQAHHIVPDNVVQNSPIHQEAINRGLYDIDRTSNGKLLAETAEDYTSLSDAYPTHFGSHPNYDDAIRAQIDDLIEVNGIDIFDLGSLSDTELINLVNAIENRAANVLTNWQPSKLN